MRERLSCTQAEHPNIFNSFKLPARRFVSELFGDVDASPEAWYDLSLRQCSTVMDAAPNNAEEEDEEEEEEAA